VKEAATILIVLLSGQGHWFSGRPASVEVRWSVKDELPEAVLSWQVEFAATRLAGERVALRSGPEPTRIVVTPPEVRIRTDMRWVYQVHRKADGQLLTEGVETLRVYPRQPLAGVAERLTDKTLLVCDTPEGLPRLLAQAGIRHTVLDGGGDAVAKLQAASGDIILIGRDQLADSPFGQTAVVNQASAGASVLLFAQTRVTRLAGYPLLRRPRPTKLEWRMDHPLLTDFGAGDLADWPRADGDVWAVQLPADEPVLEVAYWPRETPGTEPVPLDALLVVKSVGAGRMVLCQLPLGPWGEDPRVQLLVRNMLDYLATRPEPTLPPSQRGPASKPAAASAPSITIPPGDRS